MVSIEHSCSLHRSLLTKSSHLFLPQIACMEVDTIPLLFVLSGLTSISRVWYRQKIPLLLSKLQNSVHPKSMLPLCFTFSSSVATGLQSKFAHFRHRVLALIELAPWFQTNWRVHFVSMDGRLFFSSHANFAGILRMRISYRFFGSMEFQLQSIQRSCN